VGSYADRETLLNALIEPPDNTAETKGEIAKSSLSLATGKFVSVEISIDSLKFPALRQLS
jgi:hypothetical protein